MATTARLDLAIWRNDDVYEFPLRIIGPNLTSAAMRAQIRLLGDTPGAPLAALETVANGNAQGIRLASATLVDGRYVNDVRIRINKSTRQALPYAGELGDSAILRWALSISGVTRIDGRVTILAHVMDSDAAPSDRPESYGSSARQGSAPSAGATLTITQDDGVTLVIDGADLAAASTQAAQAAATSAQLAADSALAVGRYFPSQAAGEAGSSTGQAFSHPDGSGGLIYRQKTAGGSVVIGAGATAAQVAAQATALASYARDAAHVTAFQRVDVPGAAPTATADAGAGALNGTYSYRVTYLTASGETEPSQSSNEVTVANKRVTLTNLPISSNPLVTGRRVYRTSGNAVDPAAVKLVATIADNTTTTVSDNLSDGAAGDAATYFNSTGGDISINGLTILASSTSSTSFGYNAGRRGYASTFMGVSAGRNVTSGFRLTGFGVEALTSVTSGYEMAAYGIHALGNTTTGRWNNAFGYGALQSLTTAENCEAFGHRALASVTTGSRNTAVGAAAGILVSSGTDNVLLGNEAGWAITTGIGNACFGVNAGHAIGAGVFNTFLGFYCAPAATGSGNVGAGANTLTNLTSGGSNTALGSNCALRLTTGTGNTFIGNGSGSDPNQKADAFLSTAIGYAAFNTRDKEVVLGTTDTDWVVLAGVTFTRAQIQTLRNML